MDWTRASTTPNLLNDDGQASVATALLMSHHAFLRDLSRLEHALRVPPSTERSDALAGEWKGYRDALHGHHHSEDTGVFPPLYEKHVALRPTLDALTAEHHEIDPLLAQGDEAFAALAEPAAARSVIADIGRLLDRHLTREEAEVVPYLRDALAFPELSEANLPMYADGFAWSSDGVALSVLRQVDAMLPPALVARLPAARAAFADRVRRVWGSVRPGAATTPIPDP